MRRVDIDNNFGQVAETIENHYTGSRKSPPDGHPNSRTCPQCQNKTWRMTRCCIHCGIDIFENERRERVRVVTYRRIMIGAAIMVLSGLALYGQRFAPDSLRLWISGFGMVLMIIAAAIIKD